MARNSSLSRRNLTTPYQTLEPRRLLAGIVNVNISNGNLYVRGDEVANSIAIDLSAEDPSDFVRGVEETVVNVWNFNGPYHRFDRIGISLGEGDNSLIVNGAGVRVIHDLVVQTGAGVDNVSLLGSAEKHVQCPRQHRFGFRKRQRQRICVRRLCSQRRFDFGTSRTRLDERQFPANGRLHDDLWRRW